MIAPHPYESEALEQLGGGKSPCGELVIPACVASHAWSWDQN